MALEFSNTNQSHLDGINILAYGGPGTGKTTFIKTMPKPVIISAERGNLSLRGEDIPVIYVKSGLDLKLAYDFLMSPQGAAFESVAIDSLTDLAQNILNIAKAAKNDGRAAYGEMADLIVYYFKLFRSMPKKHKFFVAQQGFMKDGVTGAIKGGPDFPGQNLSKDTPYIPDMVLRFFAQEEPTTKETQYIVQTQPDQYFDAKDRSGKLPKFIRPDFRDIMYYITGQKPT